MKPKSTLSLALCTVFAAAPALANTGSENDQAIPIIALVGTFSFLIIAAGATAWAVVRTARLRAETLKLALEKGQFRPELILPSRAGDLRKGVLLLAAGLGIGVLLGALSEEWLMALVGLAPALVGAGYLVLWRFGAHAGDPERADVQGA